MRIVLDTNILVSGLLSPYGASADIVRMIASGEIWICYDTRIIFEYKEVLLREKFCFLEEHVEALIGQIEKAGHFTTTRPLTKSLPDFDDEMFLEVAIYAKADCLVTGNLKHYPKSRCEGIEVVSPRQFLDKLKNRPAF